MSVEIFKTTALGENRTRDPANIELYILTVHHHTFQNSEHVHSATVFLAQAECRSRLTRTVLPKILKLQFPQLVSVESSTISTLIKHPSR